MAALVGRQVEAAGSKIGTNTLTLSNGSTLHWWHDGKRGNTGRFFTTGWATGHRRCSA